MRKQKRKSSACILGSFEIAYGPLVARRRSQHASANWVQAYSLCSGRDLLLMTPFRKSAKKDMLLDCSPCFHISIWAVSCRILISMANMQRREFITLFCGLVAWPCVVLAQ